jgi:hypothetical protein
VAYFYVDGCETSLDGNVRVHLLNVRYSRFEKTINDSLGAFIEVLE